MTFKQAAEQVLWHALVKSGASSLGELFGSTPPLIKFTEKLISRRGLNKLYPKLPPAPPPPLNIPGLTDYKNPIMSQMHSMKGGLNREQQDRYLDTLHAELYSPGYVRHLNPFIDERLNVSGVHPLPRSGNFTTGGGPVSEQQMLDMGSKFKKYEASPQSNIDYRKLVPYPWKDTRYWTPEQLNYEAVMGRFM